MFYSLFSCSKTNEIPPQPPIIVADTMPYTWKVPQAADGFVDGSISPVIY